MKHNADTIVSLFISSSMSELLHDTTAQAGMTPKQRTLLDTVCRTAAQDALALSGTVSAQQVPATQMSVIFPLDLFDKKACAC